MQTKKEQLKSLQDQMASLHKQLNPLQKQANDLYEEIRHEEFSALLPLTPEKVMTQNYRVFEGKGYKTLQEFLRNYKFLLCEGFYSETQTKSLKLKLSQEEPLDAQVKEVMEFIPHISPMDFETFDKQRQIPRPEGLEGRVRVVSIFEHTCSSGGSYCLLVGDNNVASLLVFRYHRPTVLKTLPIEEMIAYVREHHPYELSEENKVEEDYDDEY